MIKKVNKRDSNQVKVTFVLPDDHPHGGDLSVAGDFNDWDPRASTGLCAAATTPTAPT